MYITNAASELEATMSFFLGYVFAAVCFCVSRTQNVVDQFLRNCLKRWQVRLATSE